MEKVRLKMQQQLNKQIDADKAKSKAKAEQLLQEQQVARFPSYLHDIKVLTYFVMPSQEREQELARLLQLSRGKYVHVFLSQINVCFFYILSLISFVSNALVQCL